MIKTFLEPAVQVSDGHKGRFHFKVKDNSMSSRGILEGDLVTIDRSKNSFNHADIVLAYSERNGYILINPERGKFEEVFIIGAVKEVVIAH